jgi:hypothetical protein
MIEMTQFSFEPPLPAEVCKDIETELGTGPLIQGQGGVRVDKEAGALVVNRTMVGEIRLAHQEIAQVFTAYISRLARGTKVSEIRTIQYPAMVEV